VPRKGVRICKVEPGSLAENAGLEPGDEILAVNGQDVADELALKFYLAEGLVELDVRRADGREVRMKADLEEGHGLGVQIEDFRTRTCNNDCLFCFVKQLPPGVRQLLKVKDDDYRLSFLHGNYITLTNLSESDLDRIIEHSLSPLYVSVHATDPELRTRIMGRRKVDDLAGKMRKLIAGGIRIHAQIVLMPGLNDGEMLTRTVSDLYSYYPGVDSVAVVPLGLSDYGVVREQLEQVTPSFCRDIVRQAAPWQRRFRLETSTSPTNSLYREECPFPAQATMTTLLRSRTVSGWSGIFFATSPRISNGGISHGHTCVEPLQQAGYSTRSCKNVHYGSTRSWAPILMWPKSKTNSWGRTLRWRASLPGATSLSRWRAAGWAILWSFRMRRCRGAKAFSLMTCLFPTWNTSWENPSLPAADPCAISSVFSANCEIEDILEWRLNEESN
jgi:hypothetical protein